MRCVKTLLLHNGSVRVCPTVCRNLAIIFSAAEVEPIGPSASRKDVRNTGGICVKWRHFATASCYHRHANDNPFETVVARAMNSAPANPSVFLLLRSSQAAHVGFYCHARFIAFIFQGGGRYRECIWFYWRAAAAHT